MKKISSLLNKKLEREVSLVSQILPFFTNIYPNISEKNIQYTKGIVSFITIPSGARLKILLQKKHIIEMAKKRGLYIRDIL